MNNVQIDLPSAVLVPQLSTIELSALLAERVFWWKVWRAHNNAWLALENARQRPDTPTSILDYAAHQSHCMEMLNKRVFGKAECALVHDKDGFTFHLNGRHYMVDGLTQRFPTWPRAVVMTMLSGHLDRLQDSCLGYLWKEESTYRPQRVRNPHSTY